MACSWAPCRELFHTSSPVTHEVFLLDTWEAEAQRGKACSFSYPGSYNQEMAELKFIPTQVPSDSCAPWPKCLDLSEPQFPHLYSEAVPGTALWGSFEKITFIYFWLLRVLVTMQGLLFPCGSWVYLPIQHVGSQFPDQGSNLCHLHWKMDS